MGKPWNTYVDNDDNVDNHGEKHTMNTMKLSYLFQLSEKCHWWAIIVSQHSEAFNFSNDVCSMSLLYFFRNLMPSGNQTWLAGFFL